MACSFAVPQFSFAKELNNVFMEKEESQLILTRKNQPNE